MDMIDMTKLQRIKVRLDNKHSDGSVFLDINGGQCYLLLERSGCKAEDFIYVDENGQAYNEHNKPCCTQPRFSTVMRTNQYIRLAQVERKLQELHDEINCIRNND